MRGAARKGGPYRERTRTGSGPRGGSSARAAEDVAYRVITAQRRAGSLHDREFRCRHERALAELFTGVLGLCAEGGLVKVGLIAIDGTKLHANASQHANRDFRRIAEELLSDAERVDREEDERFGEQRRGDELPEQLRTRAGAA